MKIRASIVIVLAVLGFHGASAIQGEPSWKGAESMSIVSLAPDLERCGEPPVMLARFAGDGIDARFGAFTVVASGCMDPESLSVWDLEAIDTFLDGDSVTIDAGDAQLVLDGDTCVATNVEAIPFTVAGGTGAFAGANGHGTYDIVMNWPACNGLVLPARVWFEGTLGS